MGEGGGPPPPFRFHLSPFPPEMPDTQATRILNENPAWSLGSKPFFLFYLSLRTTLAKNMPSKSKILGIITKIFTQLLRP